MVCWEYKLKARGTRFLLSWYVLKCSTLAFLLSLYPRHSLRHSWFENFQYRAFAKIYKIDWWELSNQFCLPLLKSIGHHIFNPEQNSRPWAGVSGDCDVELYSNQRPPASSTSEDQRLVLWPSCRKLGGPPRIAFRRHPLIECLKRPDSMGCLKNHLMESDVAKV